MVEKSRLLDTVWANVVVGEGSLTRTISILRKALGGEAASRAYIATVSRRGYRFVAPLDRRGEDDGPGRAMLLVLPFENSSATRPYDWFSDGLTEEMIAQLARLNPQQLGVIARTTSLMFKSSRRRVSEIGRELGVQYVLEGSVRRGRDRVRIAARLIQVSDETQVWAENYERRPGDVLRLQCEVAATIASEIQVKLTPRANPRIEAVPEIPAPAFEALLKGRHFLNQRTESAMRQSISHFETALHHCPDCAQAFAGIADANVMLARRGMVPAKETFARARAAAQRAVELDDELGDAHGSLAHLRLHDWDWDGLDQAFRRATQLDPRRRVGPARDRQENPKRHHQEPEKREQAENPRFGRHVQVHVVRRAHVVVQPGDLRAVALQTLREPSRADSDDRVVAEHQEADQLERGALQHRGIVDQRAGARAEHVPRRRIDNRLLRQAHRLARRGREPQVRQRDARGHGGDHTRTPAPARIALH